MQQDPHRPAITHSPPFPGPDEDLAKRQRHLASPQVWMNQHDGIDVVSSLVDRDLNAWAVRAEMGDLNGLFLFSPSDKGNSPMDAAALSETDAIVQRPATEKPDMSIYAPIMMTGDKPNSTSSIFCRDTVLNPNADQIILCMSSVLHVQMLQDEHADEELKRRFSIFDEQASTEATAMETNNTGGEVPAEEIHRFIERLFTWAQFSTECNIIALVYINRVIALTSMPLHRRNWKAVVLVALLIAQKVWDDRGLALSNYSTICPEFSKDRLRAMESRFLELMQYRAVVTQGLYARYFFELRALFEQLLRQSHANRPFPLKPMRLWEARKLELVSDAFGLGRQGAAQRLPRPSGLPPLPPPRPTLQQPGDGIPSAPGPSFMAGITGGDLQCPGSASAMSCASSVKSDWSSNMAPLPRPAAGQLVPPQSPGMTLEDVAVIACNCFRLSSPPHLAGLQPTRSYPGPMASSNLNAWLQLVSVGAGECSPCTLFGTEKERVMVNVGEGIQRLCMEHRVRLARLQHIVLTGLSPEELGGLPGMLLTLADISLTHITIHGPVGIRALLQSTRHFMRRDELRIDVREYPESGAAIKGEQTSFQAIVITPSADKAEVPVLRKRPRQEAEDSTATTDAILSRSGNTEETSISRSGSSKSSHGKRKREVIAYLCETAGVQGKFLVEKAKALNIPQGPLYGKLKAGITVELPDGRTIRPEEVVGPPTPGAAAVVVGIPDRSYLDSLINEPSLKAFQKDWASRWLSCMVHLTPPELLVDERYRQWMQGFGEQTTHILAVYPQGAHRSPFRAARMNNLRLNMLDSTIFPRAIPYSDHSPVDSCESWQPCKVVAGDLLLKYNLVPLSRAGLDTAAVIPAISAEDEQALREEECVRDSLAARPMEPPRPEEALPLPDGGGEIIFLGTGSALPSKYRNVTGICLRLATGGSMLLDVGEGTFHQLRSLYTRAELAQLLKDLRAIWISHSHADHHLGLMKVLEERSKVFMAQHDHVAAASSLSPPEPLLILAPTSVLTWLSEYKRQVPEVWGLNDDLLVTSELNNMTEGANTFLSERLGVAGLTNVAVDHCKHAYAMVLDAKAGWRLVYSGDCRPSERLVQLGKGAQVLIHEATFEVGKQDEAIARKHSTVMEAIDVAKRMEATSVILTHFSQRYPKFPVLPPDLHVKVCVAFDLMRVKFTDLPQASTLLPALQRLFPPEEEKENSGETAKT